MSAACQFFLIRHAHYDGIGTGTWSHLQGDGISQRGRQQAQHLAQYLEVAGVQRIFCSPYLRTRETAGILAETLKTPLEVLSSLQEVQFGDWKNQNFSDLDLLPQWKRWNQMRSFQLSPGGETFLEVQARMIRTLEELRLRCTGQKVGIVSHADPIRAALGVILKIPVDDLLRLEIEPATVSLVEISEDSAKVQGINLGGFHDD
jgi:broad specificity phosphatase PhoE